MPTRQEWIDSLCRDYRISVSTSPTTVSRVEEKQERRREEFRRKSQSPPDMKTVASVTQFQSLRHVNFKPIELLLSIGVITSPPIRNMVDISSTWAVIRYIWAFQPQNNPRHIDNLILSDEARRIDFHQKALLSDEIGVGFANLLMENYFNTFSVADMSYALRRSLHYGVWHHGKAQPDYLYFDEKSGDKFVVECKGTQTSRAESIHQLQRGTEQVITIEPTDGKRLTYFIIATCMQQQRTVVYILDPPDKDYSEPYSKIDREKERFLHPDGKSFRRETRLISISKMLTFVGLNDEAYQMVPDILREKIKRIPQPSGKMETIETKSGDYNGTTIIVDNQDGTRLEVFRGISSRLREYFFKQVKDNEGLTGEKELMFDIDESDILSDNQTLTSFVETKNDLKVTSRSHSGAILEIRD